jgi:Response regulators consisting of a CheY-like receiver domain and a winged-helix DNA-binding domain
MGLSMGHRILAVDDDPAILRSLRRGLSLEGFEVSTAPSGRAALELAEREPPDAIVLDVSMPEISGIEVCARLRERGAEVPVLMLSAMDEVADRVAGLRAGADDYVVKPYDLNELALRLRALLRRASRAAAGPPGAEEAAVLRVGPLTVDPAARRVTIGGRRVELTRREFDLLETLAYNAGIVLSRQVLLERVWGYDFAVTDNAVDTFIGYLRRKLEAGGEPRLVHTVRGVGFVLREEPA